MKILNLYSGIGGNRKLWGDDYEITAVEHDKATAEVYKYYFPNDNVLVADAHEYLLKHHKEFDFIWSSPPCPTHSQMRRCGVHSGSYDAVYPEMSLYQEIILLKYFHRIGTKWVVENVNPYYDPLIPITKKLGRHFYWSNFPIGNLKINDNCTLLKIKPTDMVYGFSVADSKIKNKGKALRNMVNPKSGKFILDCAMGIIHRADVNQIDMFEENGF
jgi:DNA (cytosine-5)-methyltransferase 1